MFSSEQVERFFSKYNKIKLINDNLIDQIYKYKSKSQKSFYSISKNVVGENYQKKLKKIKKYLRKNNADFIFITASENVAWLLNIRGFDNPNSPVPNCHLLIDKNNNLYLISEKNKVKKLINEKKINKNQVFDPKKFEKLVMGLKGNSIIVDFKTCSIFYENILKRKFKVLKKEDPIYFLKSIKNNYEIQNMLSSHVVDGAALTKFLYWIKIKNKKKITEFDAQRKLEFFRKKNKNYLYPSFNTIAGTGANGAIIHYRATKKNTRLIKKSDIFLCDSGGQYKYGTTDVTRTICFSKPKKI